MKTLVILIIFLSTFFFDGCTEHYYEYEMEVTYINGEVEILQLEGILPRLTMRGCLEINVNGSCWETVSCGVRKYKTLKSNKIIKK